MTRFARVDNAIIVEMIETDQPIGELYHPDIAAAFIEVPDEVEVNWSYTDAEGFAAPSAASPTLEQIRAAMPALSPRQFWLAASRIDVTKDAVLALVDAMEDKAAAADMRIEITETVSFQRTNEAVDQLAT
ncbi:hypothetical protein H4S14_004369, partial [Agrobacterium vitis]|nr:hypothetical protein [Agrobacterium vitis]MBE1440583.1 hypothetical protein [Agrobacterium vitis]